MKNVTLPNGIDLPIPGLSLNVRQNTDVQAAVFIKEVLQTGYRSIHFTAAAQTLFKEDFRKMADQITSGSHLPRKDLFLSVSLQPDPAGGKSFRRTFIDILLSLQTDYLDLLLLDQPAEGYAESFQEMEKLYEEKKIRSIGVDGFQKKDLIHITTTARIWPMICALDICTVSDSTDLLKWLKKYSVRPLLKIPENIEKNDLSLRPLLNHLSRKYACHEEWLLSRWAVQSGIAVFKEASNTSRGLCPIQNPVITQEDMCRIRELLFY